MTRVVRLATLDDVDQIQAIYNAAENSQFLGGMTFRDAIVSKVNAGLELVVEQDGEILGADEAGKGHVQIWKHQLVGVKPEYKRQRVATALYIGSMIKAGLNGRYLLHDTIISDNCIMPHFLTSLNYTLESTSRSKVRRHKDMGHWVLSLIDNPLTHLHRLEGLEYEYVFDFEDSKSYNANFQACQTALVSQGREEFAEQLELLRSVCLLHTTNQKEK